ncbi:hypothetical protein [Pyrococcus yayanosii]|uniref:Uncharacterized protein n=1 Tax=Pyrococcus yayanosii (strain CH1 / JCM 16557) TaxID=529709 RepID=F8AFT4_PYRYC|nr:hypothetical protein [Pyrococcus yayanosii]AEH23835.1 hypothetical protein PYCH_01260 [Pyrococcus yayanosii CH1]
MKPLKLATSLLFLNGLLLLYYAHSLGSRAYLAFSLFSIGLALGLLWESRKAVKVALIYAASEFFFALLFLMAGNVLSAIDAGISLLIIHDIIGYIEKREQNCRA